MTAWLLKLIGMNDEIVDHLHEVTLAVQHPVVFYVGLVLLIPVGYYIFSRQRHNLASAPPVLRSALTVTRILVLFLLVGVLADPYLKLHHESEKKPIVALLFDHSQSMQLPAGPFETENETIRIAQAAGYQTPNGKLDPEARKALNRITRAKLAQTVVQTSARPLVQNLGKKYDVQFFSFAKDLTQLGIHAAEPDLPEPPNPGGSATQIGDALGQILNEAGGRQIAGFVVFSDGQNTGGRSPTEVARAAAAAGAPIFTVPAGSSTRLRDVSIVDVFTTGLVSIGDQVRVAVTVESQGFDQRPVRVELRDGDKLLDAKDLVLHSTEQQQVELTFKAAEPGAKYLTVQVPPQTEEPEYLRANNTDIAFVKISDEKLKVLYVDGLPRWDFRFLKNALRRDHGLCGSAGKEPDIVLEAEWKRRPREQQFQAMPRTIKDLAAYHVVILGDASPRILDSRFVDLLAEAVRERGLGLVVEAGPSYMPHAFDRRLQELLPVRLRHAPGLEAPVTKLFRLELTPEGNLHEAMRFYDDPGRNQNAWSHMPPYYWCMAAERPAPAAAVLVWNPSIQGDYGKLPLVASHYAGKGKVLLVGTDSTWLWRQNVGDRFFYKFWGQGIRSVARRDDKDSKKSTIEVHPVRAQPGEQAQIEVMAFTPEGAPFTQATLPVQVLGSGPLNTQDTVELLADPNVKGRYTGKHLLKNTGEYRITFSPGAGAPAAEARIRVLAASEELRHPNVNRPALQMLASASGGQMVELPDLAAIPEQLKGEVKLTSLHREAPLWDNWLTLALLMFIYSLDVGLRRLAGLS
jgi:hypothetical protein